MGYYTKEQIAKARELDLLTYLSMYEPNELIHVSRNTYTTAAHDSLIISNGMWNWFSQGIGGKSALDYLIKVKGYTFMEAVEKILKIAPNINYNFPRKLTEKEKINRLIIPKKNNNCDRVRNYLMKRGIDRDIIDECIDKGLIYEQDRFHNVVFVGYDDEKRARYMGLRGITNKRYMSEASGSDKTFSFRWLGKNNNTIHLFESAIDLLSYATFEKIKGHNWYDNTLIALAGVYQPAEEIKDSKLPIALKSYLEKNKNVEEIVLHFDNDKTGRLASEVLKTILPNKYKVIDSPPKVGKDYNDFLLYFKRNNREKER